MNTKLKKTNYLFVTVILLVSMFFGSIMNANKVQAADCTPEEEGLCIDNRRCQCNQVTGTCSNTGVECGSSQVGGVTPPGSVLKYNLSTVGSGGSSGIGIILFLSNLVNLFAIVAGIFAMFNFTIADYTFLVSGSDPGAMEKVREKIMWSLVGLAIIAISYTAAGLIGAIFFGDAGFILEPAFYSVLQQ